MRKRVLDCKPAVFDRRIYNDEHTLLAAEKERGKASALRCKLCVGTRVREREDHNRLRHANFSAPQEFGKNRSHLLEASNHLVTLLLAGVGDYLEMIGADQLPFWLSGMQGEA